MCFVREDLLLSFKKAVRRLPVLDVISYVVKAVEKYPTAFTSISLSDASDVSSPSCDFAA